MTSMYAYYPVHQTLDLGELREERSAGPFDDRALVARHVLAIVAHFAYAEDVCAAAMDGVVLGPDGVPVDGPDVALVAEQLVRDLRADAEATSRPVTGRHAAGEVVCQVLGEELLLDDYLRIVAAEQHLAFDADPTQAEIDARTARLLAQAEAAAESARWFAQRQREATRVCRCGYDYGRHERNSTRERWVPRDPDPCSRFTDVEEQACTSVPSRLHRPAVESWLLRHQVEHTTTTVQLILDALETFRLGNLSGPVTFGAALETIATALDLTTATHQP